MTDEQKPKDEKQLIAVVVEAYGKLVELSDAIKVCQKELNRQARFLKINRYILLVAIAGTSGGATFGLATETGQQLLKQIAKLVLSGGL